MRLAALCAACCLAMGTVGVATAAPNLVQNGDFSSTSPNHTTPSQFGTGMGSTGQFVEGWSGTGYVLWYPSADDAINVAATNQWHTLSTLYGTVKAPPIGQSFIALDGDQQGMATATTRLQGSVSQTIDGLAPGSRYLVQFYWSGAQETSKSGDTTDQLHVTIGNATHDTPVVHNVSGGFTGWTQESFSFIADSASALLSFLSVGTPTGLPPMSVLTGVSITQVHAVPEPPVLAAFGGGLIGLGWLTVAARRRARRDAA